jgi:hypothetical protein
MKAFFENIEIVQAATDYIANATGTNQEAVGPAIERWVYELTEHAFTNPEISALLRSNEPPWTTLLSRRPADRTYENEFTGNIALLRAALEQTNIMRRTDKPRADRLAAIIEQRLVEVRKQSAASQWLQEKKHTLSLLANLQMVAS